VGIARDFRSLQLHEKRPAYWLADPEPHWQEDLVLRLAQAFEQATDWHRKVPKLDVTLVASAPGQSRSSFWQGQGQSGY
jgi:hypothetical protein